MNLKEYSIVEDKNEADSSILIYNLKLTEELVEKLVKGQKDLNNLSGIEFSISTSNDGRGSEKLKIGSETFQFMRVKETQPVQLLSAKSNQLRLMGNMTHKLNPKLELEASKAEAIRHRSQEAEKERLSRKTVELDSSAKISGHQRLIRRNSVQTTTPTIKVTNNFPLRTRVLQLLAIEPISLEFLIKKLALPNTKDLKLIIPELCGQNFDSKSLHLLTKFYGEVKIADWPFYSLRERSQVSHTISKFTSSTPINSIATSATPPETPETPSPKKQTISTHFPSKSAPSSAKKIGSTAKDRLTAIMKKRR